MSSTLPVSIAACSTCKWWQGSRTVIFGGANRPAFVKADAIPAPCLANANRPSGPSQRCVKYQRWEKL